MKKKLLALLLCAATPSVAMADGLLVNGAGATFPFPLYSKWFSEYNKHYPDMKFNYQSIGSGGGIKQITEKTVDFGASDAPMNADELGKAPGILHIPTVLGADVVTYNVPGVASGLRLTGDVIADIFLGKITRWNDPRVAKENASAKLPDLAIAVAHRSDGSGTTAIFTDYLSKVSPEWKTKVGAGKSVKFPVGIGGKGNEGVTGVVKSTAGAIGYVELAYANQNKMPMADVRNKDGNFVKPSVEAISLAAAGSTLPDDYRTSITDAGGKDSYPIAAFTYLLVYQDQTDAAKGPALIKFLWWAIHDGQQLAKPLDYAPLPKAVVEKLEKTVRGIKVNGQAGPAIK